MAANRESVDAVRSAVTGLSVVLVFALTGCHTVPVAPVVMAAPTPGTVRVLGAVAMPQVVPIPAKGLTLGGAIELAGGVATDQLSAGSVPPQQPAKPAYNVQFKNPADNPSDSPKNALFVFQRGSVLHFQAFDGAGVRFLDLDESKLRLAFIPPITVPADFKTMLLNLIAAGKDLTADQKESVVVQMKDLGAKAGVLPSKWDAGAANAPIQGQTALDPSQFLIGLRRTVNGVPNTTFFAIPLVLKYQAGSIPLQDGDLVRVVHSSATTLEKEDQVPKPGDPPPQITTFVGSLVNGSQVPISSSAVGQSYTQLRDSFGNAIDLQDYGTMNSLTRINPNDGGIETFILPNHNDKGVFPQYSTTLITSRKIQDGDIFGLTTLPQVPAIALPSINAAKDTLLGLLRSSQVSTPNESRLRRSLNALGNGQLPRVAPVTVPALPTVPRSLDLPPRGALANQIQQHIDEKHQAYGTADAAVVPATR